MRALRPRRQRLGAVALALAALLLTAFPLIRPFFPMDPTAPEATLGAASAPITSAPWLLAHSIAMAAFVLLMYGTLALYARLAHGVREALAFRGMVSSLAGIALIMPMLGVETHVMPLIGKLYLAGTAGIAPIVGLIYLGPAIMVFLLGLLLLAIGSICFAMAIWRTRGLPRWGGVIYAVGLALWFPPFPRIVCSSQWLLPFRPTKAWLSHRAGLQAEPSTWRRTSRIPSCVIQRPRSPGRMHA